MGQDVQAVPSGAPASPAAGGQQALPPELQKLMDRVSQGTRQISPGQPRPGAAEPSLGAQIGMNALSMFVPFVGGAVQKAVKMERQAQVTDVVNKLDTINNELQMAQYLFPGDKQKQNEYLDKQAQDPNSTLHAIFYGKDAKKFVKGMTKVFGADLLNPEKQNTVFHEGLKKHLEKSKATTAVKDAFGRMFGQKSQQQGGQQGQQNQQQPMQGQQGQPSASQQIGRISQKMTDNPVLDKQVQMQSEIMKTKADLDRAEVALRDKYQIQITADGSIVAINKADPDDVKNVTDGSGKPVIGRVTGKDGPMLVDKVPVGVYRAGKGYTPNSPEWTALDAKNLETYKAAYAASEAAMNARVKLSAETRAAAFLKSRMYGAMTKDGQLTFASADDMRANPGNYGPASQGVQMMNRTAIFQEIDFTKGALNDEIAKMPDVPLDAKTRAQIALVLRDTDPKSAWQGFLQSSMAETVPESMIPYITTLVSMNESAMSLRSIAGMGAGSDMLRGAISKMLPGAGTPSKTWAQQQMRLLDGEITALKKSVPHIGQTEAGKPKMSWGDFQKLLKKPAAKQ